jgi:predicted RNase H-like HicB family nuclease
MDVTAQCTFHGGWWAIKVPEVNGAFSQARSLDEVAEMAADAVGLLLEIDPATVRVRVIAEPQPVAV